MSRQAERNLGMEWGWWMGRPRGVVTRQERVRLAKGGGMSSCFVGVGGVVVSFPARLVHKRSVETKTLAEVIDRREIARANGADHAPCSASLGQL